MKMVRKTCGVSVFHEVRLKRVIQTLPSTHCTGSVSMQREWNVYKVILLLHRVVC